MYFHLENFTGFLLARPGSSFPTFGIGPAKLDTLKEAKCAPALHPQAFELGESHPQVSAHVNTCSEK